MNQPSSSDELAPEQVQVFRRVAVVIFPHLLCETEKPDSCNLILKMILLTRLARHEERGPAPWI